MTTAHRTVEISGVTYMIGKLPARKQFHLSRKLVPLVATFASLPKNKEELIAALAGPLSQALADMSMADADFIIDSCLSVVQRKEAVGGHVAWAPVFTAGVLAYDDMEMVTMLRLTGDVIMDNLGSFFTTAQLSMPNGEAKAQPTNP